MRLNQLQNRQIKADSAVQKQQVKLSVDAAFQGFESIPNTDFDKVDQPSVSQVLARTIRLVGFQLCSN